MPLQRYPNQRRKRHKGCKSTRYSSYEKSKTCLFNSMRMTSNLIFMIYLNEIFGSKSKLDAIFRNYKSTHKLRAKQANRPRVLGGKISDFNWDEWTNLRSNFGMQMALICNLIYGLFAVNFRLLNKKLKRRWNLGFFGWLGREETSALLRLGYGVKM